MSYESFLARKYVSAQKGRGLSLITWIALLGVTVGVMSLLTVLSVMSGFERELRTKILGNNAHLLVRVFGAETDRNVLDRTLDRIRDDDLTLSAMPVIYGEAFLLGPQGGSEGAFVKGVDPLEVREVLDLDQYIENADWEAFESGGMIIGSSLANSLSVFPQDSVTLILNKAELTPFGAAPKMRKLQVSDIFHSGMSQYDSGTAYVPLDVAEKLFEKPPIQVEVRTHDVREIALLKARLDEKLGDSVFIQDWLELNKSFLGALQLEKLVMGMILGLIILVAAFNICGSLIMIVRDKTKEIAILKSIGASDQSVVKVFFYQGLFIGAVGTFFGVVSGLTLSWLLRDHFQFQLDPSVYMVDRVPVDIRPTDVIFVIVGALAISALATLYPARLAARLTPTEGLKSE